MTFFVRSRDQKCHELYHFPFRPHLNTERRNPRFFCVFCTVLPFVSCARQQSTVPIHLSVATGSSSDSAKLLSQIDDIAMTKSYTC